MFVSRRQCRGLACDGESHRKRLPQDRTFHVESAALDFKHLTASAIESNQREVKPFNLLTKRAEMPRQQLYCPRIDNSRNEFDYRHQLNHWNCFSHGDHFDKLFYDLKLHNPALTG